MATANSTGKYLKDSNGNRFSPIVSAETVYVEDGVNVKNALNNKQEKLISGTNIKTINKTSLLGSGNITALTNISSYVKNNLTYSTSNTTYALSAYQGYRLSQDKQDKLVSGTNIKTINNQSLLGSGNITISGGGSSGTVLYNNPSGGQGDIELNDNLVNYNSIKIYYGMSSPNKCLEILSSAGEFVLDYVGIEDEISNDYISEKYQILEGEETGVPDSFEYYITQGFTVNDMDEVSFVNGSNPVLNIYKVIGYT